MLFYNTKKRWLTYQEKRWADEKEFYQRRDKLKQERRARFKKPSTSKAVLIFLLVNFTIVEIFTGYITIAALQLALVTGTMDFSPLVAFIGAFIGEVVTYFTYTSKAKAENTEGGILFESAMHKLRTNDGQEDVSGETDSDAQG